MHIKLLILPNLQIYNIPAKTGLSRIAKERHAVWFVIFFLCAELLPMASAGASRHVWVKGLPDTTETELAALFEKYKGRFGEEV